MSARMTTNPPYGDQGGNQNWDDPRAGNQGPGQYPPAGPPPGGNQPGYPGAYPPPRGDSSGGQQPPSLLGALFDFGFNRFATPSVIKVVYIIGFVIIGLFYLFAVVAGFYRGVGLGILALVGGAVGALFYLILLRITLEFYYAVVRMSEDIHHRR